MCHTAALWNHYKIQWTFKNKIMTILPKKKASAAKNSESESVGEHAHSQVRPNRWLLELSLWTSTRVGRCDDSKVRCNMQIIGKPELKIQIKIKLWVLCLMSILIWWPEICTVIILQYTTILITLLNYNEFSFVSPLTGQWVSWPPVCLRGCGQCWGAQMGWSRLPPPPSWPGAWISAPMAATSTLELREASVPPSSAGRLWRHSGRGSEH